MARVDYERAAADYRQGRGMSLAAIEPLRDAVAPWLAALGGTPLLDVGAGTGEFARAFAEWLGVRVLALEPAASMRREAGPAVAHPLIASLGGRAEALPLRAASCAAAWASTVLHHVPLEESARELRRVLREGAPVLVRSVFPDRETDLTLTRYFPGTRRALARYPSIERIAEVFGRSGFAAVHVEDVPQESASSLADFGARVRRAHHADTLLASLDEAELRAGLEGLDRDVATDAAGAPVVDRLTLLVLR